MPLSFPNVGNPAEVVGRPKKAPTSERHRKGRCVKYTELPDVGTLARVSLQIRGLGVYRPLFGGRKPTYRSLSG